MSYPNFIGEFVAPFEKDDWPTLVRWNERRPVVVRGALNPWELERSRYVWEQEKDAWGKIVPLKHEYRSIQKQMLEDISTFNDHLRELEKVAKKKVGISPIGGYAVMAVGAIQLGLSLASMSIPGVGWAIAIYTVVDLVITSLQGNLKKKRINGLMAIMERARLRLVVNQKRLIAIQHELKFLIESTDRARVSVQQKVVNDMEQYRQSEIRHDQHRFTVDFLREQELRMVRQATPKRVSYANDI